MKGVKEKRLSADNAEGRKRRIVLAPLSGRRAGRHRYLSPSRAKIVADCVPFSWRALGGILKAKNEGKENTISPLLFFSVIALSSVFSSSI